MPDFELLWFQIFLSDFELTVFDLKIILELSND